MYPLTEPESGKRNICFPCKMTNTSLPSMPIPWSIGSSILNSWSSRDIPATIRPDGFGTERRVDFPRTLAAFLTPPPDSWEEYCLRRWPATSSFDGIRSCFGQSRQSAFRVAETSTLLGKS
ncbi:hypothetical protein CEXT_252642 [Caerostris extrusa]|nr:hypothetical protein CEXT_252642 [Caerostris extrusa]